MMTLTVVAFVASSFCTPNLTSWGSSYQPQNDLTANGIIDLTNLDVGTAAWTPQKRSKEAAKENWGEVILNLKSSLHATVFQLAQALNVSRQTVHAWQRGEKKPAIEAQTRISALVNASVSVQKQLGNKLPIYINFEIGDNNETFWKLISAGMPIQDASEILVKVAKASSARRALAALSFDA